MGEEKLITLEQAAEISADNRSILLMEGFEAIAIVLQLQNKSSKIRTVLELGKTLSTKILEEERILQMRIGNHERVERKNDLILPENVLKQQLEAAYKNTKFVPVELPVELATRFPFWYQTIEDPFLKRKQMVGIALSPDLAIVHVARADRYGNAQLDPTDSPDRICRARLACSAKKIIISAEQIVSRKAIEMNRRFQVFDADEVYAVAEAPYGSFPVSYSTRYRACEELWNDIKNDYQNSNGWYDYLEKIGIQKLMSATINRRGV